MEFQVIRLWNFISSLISKSMVAPFAILLQKIDLLLTSPNVVYDHRLIVLSLGDFGLLLLVQVSTVYSANILMVTTEPQNYFMCKVLT